MTKTKGRNSVDINQRVPFDGDVAAYLDWISLRFTFANALSDEKIHISLDAGTFEQLLRFARNRAGGDFAAGVVNVANDS